MTSRSPQLAHLFSAPAGPSDVATGGASDSERNPWRASFERTPPRRGGRNQSRIVSAIRALILISLLFPRLSLAQRIDKDLPPAARGTEITNQIGHQVPLDLEFTDSSGKKLTLAQLFNHPTTDATSSTIIKGRPVILMMMYYRCPLLCPQTLHELLDTLNKLDFNVGSDFDVAIVSFDPRDTPADAAAKKSDALMSYERPTTDAIRSSFSFLTGTAESSRKLADAIGFNYKFLPESGEYSHRAVIFVLTPDGKVSRYLPGLQSILGEFKTRDVRLSLIEASQGRLGSWIDQNILLPCFHYDPNAGGYVLFAVRVMKIGAGLAALLLGGTVGLLFLGERRRHRRLLAAAAAPASVLTSADARSSGPAPGPTQP